MGRRIHFLSLLFFAALALSLSADPHDCSAQQLRQEPRYQYGLSLLTGYGRQDELDLQYYAAYPRLGWFPFERWLVEVEGNIGHYRLNTLDTTSLGLNALISYEIFHFDHSSVILTGGGGLSYLDIRERPRVGDSPIVALAQVGVGLKLPISGETLLRLEYRFQHVSDPFDTNDTGWNYHCIVVGFSNLVF